MTYLEIMGILQKSMSITEFAHEDYGTRTGTGGQFIKEIGECTEVDSYGGEDKGSDWWTIKYFPDHDVYVKVEGDYSSYDGVEFYNGWRCCHEVKPQEKMVIVYKKV